MAFAANTAPRTVLADLVPGERVRDAALVVTGAGLTGLAAQVAIHTSLSPVPFTLQTLAVLVVGSALGPVRGAVSMLVYLLAGIAGTPWFADHGSGWAGNPSFGYIIAFVPTAAVVGALARRGADRHVLTTAVLMVAGNVVVYLIGASYLAADLHLSAAQAWHLGVRPFLVSDAMKLVLASLAFPAAWRLVRR
jgi:biotin transport system substrate-specific component